MSRSAGPGSPGWFMCYEQRRRSYWRNSTTGEMRKEIEPDEMHRVERTGRTREYRPKPYSALGQRSLLTSHEYRCSCGHVGWSNHTDVVLHPIASPEA